MTRLTDQMEFALGYSFVAGNHIEVLCNGDKIFPAMLKAINDAEDSICFVTHVYWTGEIAVEFADAMTQAALRGVNTKVLLDAIGCNSMRKELVEQMESAGVQVAWFRPVSQWKIWKWDKRTHRKLLLCDQNVAFTGGVGIAEEWQGNAQDPSSWRDTHFRITGPVVLNMYSGFFTNWNEASKVDGENRLEPKKPAVCGDARVQVVRSPASINWSDIATVFRTLLIEARESIWITTAYFVPDDTLAGLMCSAAKRGVDVRVLVPGQHTDQRLSQLSGEDQFRRLLDSGVTIHLFDPTMLHSKIMTVDHCLAVVGSANMNHRSMSKDDEFCLVVEDAKTLSTLEQQFEDDLERSHVLDLSDWKERGPVRRAGEYIARLFRGQM